MKTKLILFTLLLTLVITPILIGGCGNPAGEWDTSSGWAYDYKIWVVSDNVLGVEFGDEVDEVFKGKYALQEALQEINEEHTITGLSVCYSGDWICYAYVIVKPKIPNGGE